MNALAALAGLSLALAPGGPARAATDWEAVWDDLVRLDSLAAESEEAQALVARLARAAEEGEDAPRTELLRRQLSRRRGEASTSLPAFTAAVPWPFAGRETWLAAEVLPPGPERVRTVLWALDELPAATDRRYLTTAWSAAVDEARALRLAKGALPIQERLHAEFAAPWSALDLALTLTWLDRAGEADRVLAAAIEREREGGRPGAELWSQRGILALGAGNERRARDYLGRALARGSADAAIVLGRLDLDHGRNRSARVAFRALSWDALPGDWAQRGWGLSLLPALPTESPDRPTDAKAR
ncbi:MAG: hypothetical protein AB1726_06775 [Planctomycetota bacterium]